MIAAYIRVSSTDQDPKSQRAAIIEWAEHEGINPKQLKWFEDKVTGKTLRRPAYIKLSQAVVAGEVETVIVWKLDRLTRSLLDGVQILSEWSRLGVRIVSVTQDIDLTGVTGKLVASVMFAVAEMELNHIRERQAAGIKLAKAAGKYTGRRKGATKANPARAKELHSRGLKNSEIAAVMEISLDTVKRYLAS